MHGSFLPGHVFLSYADQGRTRPRKLAEPFGLRPTRSSFYYEEGNQGTKASAPLNRITETSEERRMKIEEILARRSDLSTFLVHFTKGDNAAENLKAILSSGILEARNPFGSAHSKLSNDVDVKSQHVVCFTETPLEYLHLFLSEIEGRQFSFKPYGMLISKEQGRTKGINPVWYLDMTPGHDWLTNHLDALVRSEMKGEFSKSPLSKLTPFIEQMGTWPGAGRKEFWWEREWRHPGNFSLPGEIVGLCPENEISDFESHAQKYGRKVCFIDPTWGLERTIAHLSGLKKIDSAPPLRKVG